MNGGLSLNGLQSAVGLKLPETIYDDLWLKGLESISDDLAEQLAQYHKSRLRVPKEIEARINEFRNKKKE
jgi:hypothetical protein